MPLVSRLFGGDVALEACRVRDSAHLTQGSQGDHVGKVQAALIALDGSVIDQGELDGQFYGPSTAAAVLAYKQGRQIINRAYQNTADNVVGKMTIQALDDELQSRQADPRPASVGPCPVDSPGSPQAVRNSFERSRAVLGRS